MLSAIVASAAAASVPMATTVGVAGAQGSCTATSGVTVVVDFTAFGRGIVRGCAPGSPSSGYAALVAAGFVPVGTARFGNAFVCRIDALPSPAAQACVDTPPATAYWAYYHAAAGDTTWHYSSLGVTSSRPTPGSVEAWAFGASAKPSLSPAQALPPPPTVPPTPAPTTAAPPTPPPTAPPPPAPPTTRPSAASPGAPVSVLSSSAGTPSAAPSAATAASFSHEPRHDEPRHDDGCSDHHRPDRLVVDRSGGDRGRVRRGLGSRRTRGRA